MSKLKLSLSAVFMLLLFGMFAAAASAAAITPTSTHPAESGLTTPINGVDTMSGIYVGDRDNNGDVSTHRTHGNFQNNTNSCANCHSTHNGENEQLLMKSGEYELCMACHDGTMGFYNVNSGSEAGVFSMYGEDKSHSASMHSVNSDAIINAAPGAIAQSTTSDIGNFECSSCHNPHGSANDRLLNAKVAGKDFGWTYQYALNGYTEIITKVATVPAGTPAVKLALTEDTAYAAINAMSGQTGLKIYKSNGPLDDGTVSGHMYKLNYSEYCSSCHDAYLANRENGARQKGDNETATVHYTHTTNSAKQGRSCVACHYAHGTDETTLMDTAGKKLDALTTQFGDATKAQEYIKDVSVKGSSLKRFTNMAVCFACHQSTHKIDTPTVTGGNYAGKSLIK